MPSDSGRPRNAVQVRFTLNGRPVEVVAEPHETLLYVLRERLGLTGTKQACDQEGECGACTVLVDGDAVRSCLMPVLKAEGRRVVTIEGLGTAGDLHPLQEAFIECGAVQCGYCTPGMILSAAALLEHELDPSRRQIVEALEGNLCRCTGYTKIIEAVQRAAAVMRGDARPVSPGPPVVGGTELREDALDKVLGSALYAEDIKLPGLLHAALVRSPHPHARLLGIDTSPALGIPGVDRVLTAADIPGRNSLVGYSRGEHLLAPVGGTVRMIGDAVALVIAESPDSAARAADAVRVEYDPLRHTYDASDAMSPGAPALYPAGNVLSSQEIAYGDMGTAVSDADLVLEARYETPFMEHSAMERESVLSYVDEEGRIAVVAGHQQPHWARGWTAQVLGVPQDSVRVIVPPMGGAFGGKQDPWPLAAGALAAYHTRRPVRLVYSRRESFEASPKRHPYTIDLRVASKRDGTLAGLRLRVLANTGAYDCDGYNIPEYALVAGGGPYRWAAVDAHAWSVYSNGPKAGQMRGFGTPQSAFALECMLDEVAGELGLDPLELRLRNALADGDMTFLGYPMAESFGYRQCLEAVAPRYQSAIAAAKQWNQRFAGLARRRGVGLAGMWYRFGKPGSLDCEAQAELGLDGSVSLYFAAPDYGQGTTTVMSQLAAEVFGLPRHSLTMVNADTAQTPDSGIQGASRSTYWVGGAVVRAAQALRDRVVSTASEVLDQQPDRLAISEGGVVAPDGRCLGLGEIAAEMERIGLPRRVVGVFTPEVGERLSGSQRPTYAPFFVSGAQVAEVEVDLATGQVRVDHVTAAHDVGRVINPQGARGQVEGAVMMSLGAALMEEFLPGTSTGFSDYYLPTIRSAPEIEVYLVEVPSRWGPLGVKGLGEGATLPTAPAILSAIHDASGARVRKLPATPERVLMAIRQTSTR